MEKGNDIGLSPQAVLEERAAIWNFFKEVRHKSILLVEGTHSQENLRYKKESPDAGRGILSIAKTLKELGLRYSLIESTDPELDRAITQSDVVFIYAHGEYGEDGRLQGWLDYKGIAYIGPGVFGSALCCDKLKFKYAVKGDNLNTPLFMEIPTSSTMNDLVAEINKRLYFPIMAKLRPGGSSIGITFLEDESTLQEWIQNTPPHELPHYFFEQYIAGRFVTVGLIKMAAGLITLPPLEVKSGTRYYDEQVKLGAHADSAPPEYFVPAPLDEITLKKVADIAQKAFLVAECDVLGRVDLMIDNSGEPHLLEINTIPGVAPNSNFTNAFQSVGFSYAELVLSVLRTAFLKGATHEIRADGEIYQSALA
ncbi:MAG: hypothetical protein HY696_03235 [Deltaproteobacteria bacterium]|nr:hypothetical protein [Deltaproteobacteria bacterium]